MSNISKFQIGRYYHVELSKDRYVIVRYKQEVFKDTTRINGEYVGNMNNGNFYYKANCNVFIGSGRKCREATLEEKAWLQACIRDNSVVDRAKVNIIGPYSIWFEKA